MDVAVMFYSVKAFFFSICFFYIFIKFSHYVPKKEKMTYLIIISLYIGLLSELTGNFFSSFSTVCLLLCLTLSAIVLFKNNLRITIVNSVISYSLSVIISVVALVINMILPTTYLLFKMQNTYHQTPLQQFGMRITVGALQIFIIYLFFRIKRFKALYRTRYDYSKNIIFYISFTVLLISNLIVYIQIDSVEKTVIFLILIFLIISVLLVWTDRVNTIYKEKLRLRESELLTQKIDEQKKQLDFYKQHSDSLSGIIHKDNKVIPAMAIAVRSVLNGETTDKNKIAELLVQLDDLYSARENEVKNYEENNHAFSMTGILSVDAVVSFFQKKSKECGVNIVFLYRTNLRNYIDKTVSEKDLHTLIADLCENAIIAVENCAIKNVLLSITDESGVLSVNVYDSGVEFTLKTLCNIGISRYTTHKKSGGSGIGMMTAFEIMRRCSASYELDEVIETENYTKKVGIVFDGKNMFYIHTNRTQLNEVSSYRKSVIFR